MGLGMPHTRDDKVVMLDDRRDCRRRRADPSASHELEILDEASRNLQAAAAAAIRMVDMMRCRLGLPRL